MHRWLMLSASTLLLGCDSVVGCDPCRNTAIAYGTVTDAQGNPFDGRIAVHAFTRTCGTGFVGGEHAVTNASGEYRTIMSSLYKPRAARCFWVIIDPELDMPDVPTDTVEFSGSVEFLFEEDESQMDSIRLDVVLPVAQ